MLTHTLEFCQRAEERGVYDTDVTVWGRRID
jgi:hypothetical protein